jgi:hypothetical protein
VFTVVQYGKEVGLPPVQALNNVAIINGKLSMSGASMLALGYKHGVTAEFKQEDEKGCEILFEREGHKPYTSTFTIEDADKAQLGDRDKDGKLKTSSVWYKYTSTMLKWRAVAKGMRMIAPDVLAGVYTKDEIVNIPTSSTDVIQNDTLDISDEPENVAQKDTPNEETQVADKITQPQMKRLHALMNEKGVAPFRDGFKAFLSTFEDSGIDATGSAKDLSKDFASSLVGDFDKYARTFFGSDKSKTYLDSTWKELDRKTKTQVIAGMKTLIKGGESFPLEVKDDTPDTMVNDWFALMLTAVKNQETNRVADAGEKKGMSAEEVKETLEDLGMKPEVVNKAETPKEEKKEAPKQETKKDDLLDF